MTVAKCCTAVLSHPFDAAVRMMVTNRRQASAAVNKHMAQHVDNDAVTNQPVMPSPSGNDWQQYTCNNKVIATCRGIAVTTGKHLLPRVLKRAGNNAYS